MDTKSFDINEWVYTEEDTPKPETEMQPEVKESKVKEKSKHRRSKHKRDAEGKKLKRKRESREGNEEAEARTILPEPISSHSDSFTTSECTPYNCSTSYSSYSDPILPYDPCIFPYHDPSFYSTAETCVYPDTILNYFLHDPQQPFVLTPTPITASTPVPIDAPTPSRIPNSRGRRARMDGNPRRTYKCEFPGCTDVFGRQDHLRRHEMAHRKERPFVCPTCGHLFSRADNMNSHRRHVHDER